MLEKIQMKTNIYQSITFSTGDAAQILKTNLMYCLSFTHPPIGALPKTRKVGYLEKGERETTFEDPRIVMSVQIEGNSGQRRMDKDENPDAWVQGGRSSEIGYTDR